VTRTRQLNLNTTVVLTRLKAGGFSFGFPSHFRRFGSVSLRPQALFSVGLSWSVACVLFLFDNMALIALIWFLSMDRWMNISMNDDDSDERNEWWWMTGYLLGSN